jgi:predicted CoA-binding protein
MEENMEALIQEFTDLRVWAVVGASNDAVKFGNKVFRSMTAAGYRVYGVNPKGGEIDGTALYPSLDALPEKPDVVDLVVPPAVTAQVVSQCAELGLTRVWMQPGAESEAAIQFCHDHGIRVVHDACAMIRKRFWQD